MSRVLQRGCPLRSLAILVALAVPISARSQAPDPILGTWLGTAGCPDNRTVFGLDVRASSDGTLTARLTLEAMNTFGEPLSSFTAKGAGRYALPDLGLELTLDGSTLRGTLANGAPIELSRSHTLPTDAPLPTDLPIGPDLAWELQLGSAAWSTPAARETVIYLGTTGGVLHAVNATDGSLAWTAPIGRPMFGAPLATDTGVFVVADDGYLHARAPDDGRELWRHDLGDARVPRVLPHPSVYDYDHDAPTPVLANGVLYVGSADGALHAVDAATGAQVWRAPAKGKVRASAAVCGDRIVFGTLDGELACVERASGRDVWRKDAAGGVTSAPTLLGGRLVVGTRGSVLAGLDPATGETSWRIGFWGSWVESSPVELGDGLAVVGSSDLRRVLAFDPRDGRAVWRADVFGWSWGRPIVRGDVVLVATTGVAPYSIRHVAALTGLDRRTGKLLWRRPFARPEGAFCWGYAGGGALVADRYVVADLSGVLRALALD
ncbi:MAG: PQQ-binding-like beta-propeller repeat protein [Planctomycetes bacterium]|nr:PQQ-binding-like beta-propeller repeat protein [Planctomycetota bacterium]